MLFLILITLGVLFLAGNVIFFSVWGLAQTFTFTAFFWGSAIESSKLLVASFLYRFWNKINLLSKSIGILLVVGLMIITSAGIYGHILAGYQEGNIEIEAQQLRLVEAEERRDRFSTRISDLDNEIEATRDEISALNRDISAISTRDDAYITARSRAASEIREDRNIMQDRLSVLLERREELSNDMAPYQEEIINLRAELLDVEAKVGPIVTIIEAFGGAGERAIMWFILLIVLTFDPTAVYLTVKANKVAMELSKEKKSQKKEKPLEEDNEEILSIKKMLEEKDNSSEALNEALAKLNDISTQSKEKNEQIDRITKMLDKEQKKKELKRNISSSS
jgi:peptidoglycan hydrolase CwlO-like protein